MEKLTSSNLKGNWATLLLATDSQGRLDMARLSDEMDVLIASSPDGIYSNGTACEFYSQSMEEFVTISEMLASKCTAAGVAFQIGVSHPCAQTSLERLRLVTPLKPGAIQVILPDWFPVSDDEAVVFLSEMERNADGIPLVLYNPPHAKRVLKPEGWQMLKRKVPSLTGVKVFDENCSEEWYGQMRANSDGISVFVPGHHLATGVKNGASGAYSNVACLNPTAAQKWYDMICSDMESALELESRIREQNTSFSEEGQENSPGMGGMGIPNCVLRLYLYIGEGFQFAIKNNASGEGTSVCLSYTGRWRDV